MKHEEQFPKWHVNADLDNAVMQQLAALMRLGHVDEATLMADELGYLRMVAGALAGAVGSMPAVQRAMAAAHPGWNRVECYEEMVRAIAKILTVDGDALLEGPLRPKVSKSSPELPSMPARPVN